MHGDDLAIFLFFMTLVFAFGLEALKAATVARRVGFGVLATVFLGMLYFGIKSNKSHRF
jgi:hypothetical protein